MIQHHELILNNYVANTDKANIVKQYETVIRRQEDIDSMLDDFGIEECVAKFKEMKAIGFKTGVIVQNLSIFNSFRKYAGKRCLKNITILLQRHILMSTPNSENYY